MTDCKGKVRVVKDTTWDGEGYLTVGKIYDVMWRIPGGFFTLLGDDYGRQILDNFNRPNHGYEYEVVTEDDEKILERVQDDCRVANDSVNHPSHYGQGNIEAIEYIEDSLTNEEYIGYLRGNIAKYLHRWRYKNGVEDLEKAKWYLYRLIKVMSE